MAANKPGPRIGSKQKNPKQPARSILYLELAWQGISHMEIASRCGVTQQAVSGALSWLTARGYNVPESQFGTHSHRRNKEKSSS